MGEGESRVLNFGLCIYHAVESSLDGVNVGGVNGSSHPATPHPHRDFVIENYGNCKGNVIVRHESDAIYLDIHDIVGKPQQNHSIIPPSALRFISHHLSTTTPLIVAPDASILVRVTLKAKRFEAIVAPISVTNEQGDLLAVVNLHAVCGTRESKLTGTLADFKQMGLQETQTRSLRLVNTGDLPLPYTARLITSHAHEVTLTTRVILPRVAAPQMPSATPVSLKPYDLSDLGEPMSWLEAGEELEMVVEIASNKKGVMDGVVVVGCNVGEDLQVEKFPFSLEVYEEQLVMDSVETHEFGRISEGGTAILVHDSSASAFLLFLFQGIVYDFQL